MKQSSYKGKSPLPDFVIDAACADEAALRLLREGWIRVLGTDCHNMTSRAPRMDEAVRRIARALGEDAVQRLEMRAAALLPAGEADP